MKPGDSHKSDRALELYEKGVRPSQIAERLGSSPQSVSAMILAAKHRRAARQAREAMMAREVVQE